MAPAGDPDDESSGLPGQVCPWGRPRGAPDAGTMARKGAIQACGPRPADIHGRWGSRCNPSGRRAKPPWGADQVSGSAPCRPGGLLARSSLSLRLTDLPDDYSAKAAATVLAVGIPVRRGLWPGPRAGVSHPPAAGASLAPCLEGQNRGKREASPGPQCRTDGDRAPIFDLKGELASVPVTTNTLGTIPRAPTVPHRPMERMVDGEPACRRDSVQPPRRPG